MYTVTCLQQLQSAFIITHLHHQSMSVTTVYYTDKNSYHNYKYSYYWQFVHNVTGSTADKQKISK